MSIPWNTIWATGRKKVKTVDGRWHVGHIDLGLPVARKWTGRRLIFRELRLRGLSTAGEVEGSLSFRSR